MSNKNNFIYNFIQSEIHDLYKLFLKMRQNFEKIRLFKHI